MEFKISASGKAVHALSVIACVHHLNWEASEKRLSAYRKKDPSLEHRLSRSEFIGGNGKKETWACSNWAETIVLVEEKTKDGKNISIV